MTRHPKSEPPSSTPAQLNSPRRFFPPRITALSTTRKERRSIISFAAFCVTCLFALGLPAYASTGVFPGTDWEEATPETQGVDAAKLQAAVQLLDQTVGRDGARELVIIRNGRMIWKGSDIDRRHGIWSATKSFTSTALGLLVEDGKCTLNTRVADILPELKQHYPAVTLRHFTTMTSGYRAVGDETTGTYKHGPSNTPFTPNPKPLFTPPGSQYAYWDSAMNTLALALTKIAGEPIEELVRRRIANPIGMKNWDWGDYATVDGLVVNGGSGNANKHVFISARELARFGLLFLNHGRWNDRQLISSNWIARATRVQVPGSIPWAQPESNIDGRGLYGFNWWRNGLKPDGARKFPAAPEGMFWASGHNNNKCFVIPEWDVVIVRLGLDGKAQDEVWNNFFAKLGEAVTPAARLSRTHTDPVRIIFDTDMHTDCDDAGALAVLHVLADKGECEILATVVSVKDYLSAATVNAINTYYGRPDLPIGMVKGPGVLRHSIFTARIAADFPNCVKSADDVPDALEVYRQILEQQPDRSVVVVTVGYLTNLRNLLLLPATGARLSGRDLIQRKVAKWVCMGGNFIGHPPSDDLKLGNVNFQHDASATLHAIQNWPTPIIFVGREIGSVPSGLQAGAVLGKTPPDNPVRMAYSHYFGGRQKSRHVADLTTVLYAVRGLRDYWGISNPGRVRLQPDVKFHWEFTPEGNQRFLLKKQRDGQPNDRYLESVLDQLLIVPPRKPTSSSVPAPNTPGAPSEKSTL